MSDISLWLHSLGLERYESVFRDNDIDETLLVNLTDEDLKEIGVASLGHRRRLLSAIAAMRAHPDPSPDPSQDAQSFDESEEVTQDVNLRASQVAFLDILASDLELDLSQICRGILAIYFPDIGDQESAAKLQSATTRADMRDLLTGVRIAHAHDDPWFEQDIGLSQQDVTRLQQTAQMEESSPSRVIRHAIAQYMEEIEFSRSEAGGLGMARGRPRWRRAGLYGLVALLTVAAALVAVYDFGPFAKGPRFVTAVPWAGSPADIILDSHTHTHFSDGELEPEALVEKAILSGCTAMAITDHSSTKGAASPEQLERIAALRDAHPDFLLFGGLELDMPSYKAREHVSAIVLPGREQDILPTLKQWAGKEGGKEAETELFQQVVAHRQAGETVVLIYNHPSRKDLSHKENFTDMLTWNGAERLFIGFEGAPGHQNAPAIGSYEGPIGTLDRWDPAVAVVGGTWDQLLSAGHDFWGALAGSDFHNDSLDFAPCAFARTHVSARAADYEAVLDALEAGSFWADHGRILEQLVFYGHLEGLAEPLYPGSVAHLGTAPPLLRAGITLARGPGSFDRPLTVEFIGNCQDGRGAVLAQKTLAPEEYDFSAEIALTARGADQRSCFLRSRVRLDREDGTAFLAYSNPFRILF